MPERKQRDKRKNSKSWSDMLDISHFVERIASIVTLSGAAHICSNTVGWTVVELYRHCSHHLCECLPFWRLAWIFTGPSLQEDDQSNGNVCIQLLSQNGNHHQDILLCAHQRETSFSEEPLHSLCPSISVSLSLCLASYVAFISSSFSPSLLLHPSRPPPPVSPPVFGGVVNTMSFLSLSAARVASAGDELPVDNFVFAEHSDSQLRGHSQQTGNLWKLPFWKFTPQVSVYPP